MNKIVVRNILLLILLLVVLAVVLVVRGRSPFGKTQSSFAVETKKEITAIELIQGSRKLTLAKHNGSWKVNGKSEARKNGVDFIIQILTEIKIKSPVSPELFRSEITGKNVVPVKVRVYEKSRLIRSFLVYKTMLNKYGNIMKMKAGSKPFIVYVPGFEGDIGSGFTLNELFWQPYTVFNLLPSEISSVRFENSVDTASSFEIGNKCNMYTLSDTHHQLSGWDTSQVKRYISYFTWIPFENWALNLSDSEKVKIRSQKPLFVITVMRTGGTETELSLRERRDEKTGSVDSDRLWGSMNGKHDLFVMRYFDIDPVIKKRSYFFPK